MRRSLLGLITLILLREPLTILPAEDRFPWRSVAVLGLVGLAYLAHRLITDPARPEPGAAPSASDAPSDPAASPRALPGVAAAAPEPPPLPAATEMAPREPGVAAAEAPDAPQPLPIAEDAPGEPVMAEAPPPPPPPPSGPEVATAVAAPAPLLEAEAPPLASAADAPGEVSAPAPYHGVAAGRPRSGGWAKVPYALQHSTAHRKVRGVVQKVRLGAEHAALYAQIQRWERDLSNGSRTPCCASWKNILAAWPGAPSQRWAQILLGELLAAGWVRQVPVKWVGTTQRGLLTVREGEYQALDLGAPPAVAESSSSDEDLAPAARTPEGDVTPPALTLTPLTSGSPPLTSGSPPPDPDVTQTRIGDLDRDPTGPPPARDPRGPGAGGLSGDAPRPDPVAPADLPAVPVRQRRPSPRRTTPLPPSLQGLPLCGWLIGGEYSDEALEQALLDVRRAYRGDLSQLRSLSRTIEKALLARREGNPWGPRPDPARAQPVRSALAERAALPPEEEARRREEQRANLAQLRRQLTGGCHAEA